MSSRETSVAGTFYPAECSDIEGYIARFNAVLEDNNYNSSEVDVTPRAIIVPHAGYIYSGFTANVAFRTAAEKRESVKRVVFLGPRHRVSTIGASIPFYSH